MNKTPTQYRILAIAPSARGFGFAVLEAEGDLLDWGVKSVTGDKNTQSLVKVKKLLTDYEPRMLVLEKPSNRRRARIQVLNSLITKMAQEQKVKVRLIPREQVHRIFGLGEKGTKQTLAEVIATRFPQELGSRLPPKRRPWTSEDYRMGIFDAMALVLVPGFRNENRKSKH